MNKATKLLTIILLSLSTYFIYQITNNKICQITVIGDNYSIGYDSYGIKDSGYVEYLKEYLEENKIIVKINNDNQQKENNINTMLIKLENTRKIRKDLINSDIVLIQIGMNDVLLNKVTENEIDYKKINNNYNLLIENIRKYTKNKIIVIGYYNYPSDINKKEIIKLNKILRSNKEIIYIDTYNLLENKNKYFSNISSFYPNIRGYSAISKEIIKKSIEKQ